LKNEQKTGVLFLEAKTFVIENHWVKKGAKAVGAHSFAYTIEILKPNVKVHLAAQFVKG
jgi:hypothetical protein